MKMMLLASAAFVLAGFGVVQAGVASLELGGVAVHSQGTVLQMVRNGGDDGGGDDNGGGHHGGDSSDDDDGDDGDGDDSASRDDDNDNDSNRRRPRVPGGSGCDDAGDMAEHAECRP